MLNETGKKAVSTSGVVRRSRLGLTAGSGGISVGQTVKTLDENNKPVWGVVQEVYPTKLIVLVRGLDEEWAPEVVLQVN